MVGRASRWRALGGIVVVGCLSGGVGEARPRPKGPEPAADVVGSRTILAGARVKIGQGAIVGGDVHSNGRVELKKGSTVSGDVSAVYEVKNQGGTVSGAIVTDAAPIALSPVPSRAEARAGADRVVAGPLVLVDPRIDDVLFVSGQVTIRGSAQGAGTLIATGAVTVTRAASGAQPAVGSTALSILSYADVTMAARASLHAAVRSAGRVMLGEEASFQGWLAADRDVELARGARVTMGRPVDGTPPTLAFLGPSDPFVTSTPSLDLVVLYADAEPGLDLASFALHLDGIAVTDRCTVGPSAATCSLALGASGRRQIAAAVSDLAGNLGTRALELTAILDLEPPSIVIESPADGALVSVAETSVAGSVTDDGAVTSVTVGGAVVEAVDGRFAGVVALVEGANAIRVAARDSTGKETERSVTVTLDSLAPRLALYAPPALVTATHLPTMVVAGEAGDDHGLAVLEIEGIAVPVVAGRFETEVSLYEGVNRIRVTATDLAGNAAAVDVEIERFTVPVVTVVSPADGALVTGPVVDVHGTLDDPTAIVTVNGLQAAVEGAIFRREGLPVAGGATLINVIATAGSGLVGVAGVTVVRDSLPPSITIHEPADGATVYQPAIAVTGMVNDAVVGTVNAAQVTVTVNGIAAEVANRSFLLHRLPLLPGENSIEVIATDPSGNVGRHAVTVRRAATSVATIAVHSGDAQSAVAGETLPLPLVASVRDEIGMPVQGRAVVFVADGTDGAFDGGERGIAVTTDSAGRASATLTLGRRAGLHTVRATATGFAGEALFVARAHAAEAALLVADSGDQQVGAAGQELRAPFAAVVTDDGFNRLEGVAVRFEVVEGFGRFENGEASIDQVSDSDGRVTARLTLGDEEGVGNNAAQARIVSGPEDAAVTFAASALVAGDPAATSVSGVVLDNSDQPVPGATVSLEGTTLVARTDAAGVFRLDGAPPGTTHLRVSGSTVERPGVWPSLEFLITIVPGRDNDMGRPLFLPVLETENALAVDEATGGVLEMRAIPGFALYVEPGSVTFPGGGRSGVITVTPVHGDKVPMPPNFGQQPRFVITIQPGGARFVPPARVTYPNVDGLSPGQVTELYSFDHDLARFVSIGPGTVSADGTRIESAPGVGIGKAGWHGGGDPARPGICHDCGECKKLVGGACVADDRLIPEQNAPDDCRREHCRGGRVSSEMTNQENAVQIAGNCYEELCPTPHRAVDLADPPPGRKCCGDPSFPLPGGINRGRLTGIYDPETQCCVDDARSVISKKAPIDLAKCPKPVPPEIPVDVEFDGCSVPLFAQVILVAVDLGAPYSGDPDEPTPPAQGDALFSRFGLEEPPMGPCDLHDRCYQTCDSSREDCDRSFGGDLMAACDDVSGTVAVPAPSGGFDIQYDRRTVCEEWASLYEIAVATAGGPAHRSGQASHCDCECS